MSTTCATSHGEGGGGSSAASGGAAGAAGSPGGGVNLLGNPSFEEGWTAWSVDPAAAQTKYANVKWPQPGSFTPNGEPEEYLLGTWHMTDAYVLSVFQSIDSVADGSYTFSGLFNWGGPVASVQIFARNCGSEDIYEDVPPTASTQWLEVSIEEIEVVGGHCEVGLAVDSSAEGWLNADMFRFELGLQ
jgi:arabinogalactan endo-1,4-beta-galactosidase